MMADDEDVQRQSSIHDRIAALNLGHVGRAPITATPAKRPVPPPPPKRGNTANIPTISSQANEIGNEPSGGVNGRGILPAPQGIVRTGQMVNGRNGLSPPNGNRAKPAPPPRLPPPRTGTVAPATTKAPPALPARAPPEQFGRRGSQDSVSSAHSSVSTISTASSAVRAGSTDSGRMRAPVYDPATLPPLPPKRAQTDKEKFGLRAGPVGTTKFLAPTAAKVVSRAPESKAPGPAPVQPPALPQRASTSDVLQITQGRKLPPPAVPPLPSRSPVHELRDVSGAAVPPLPSRSPVNGLREAGVAASTGTVRSASSLLELDSLLAEAQSSCAVIYFTQDSCPPCKPCGPVYDALAAEHAGEVVLIKVNIRAGKSYEIFSRHPIQSTPTFISFLHGSQLDQWRSGDTDMLRNNIRSLVQRAKGHGASEASTSTTSAPPPVPTNSRPDLSKLLATKPKVSAAPPKARTRPSPAQGSCLLCYDFSAVDAHAAKFPRQNVPSLDWLAGQLTSPFPTLKEKARAIFTWLHHNIYYDVEAFFNNRVQPSTPSQTLATGLAVCEGYAGLFSAIAAKAGLESIVVGGHGKGFGYAAPAPGSPPPPRDPSGHAWNAVKLDDGRWKLIDCCWGAGAVQGAGQPYQPGFTPSQFTMDNCDFGRTHFPANAAHFFRTDGRASVSWEEYVTGALDGLPAGNTEPVLVYSNVAPAEGFSTFSFSPRQGKLPLHDPASFCFSGDTVRFRFERVCPHWDPLVNGPGPEYQYVLALGKSSPYKNMLPFESDGFAWWCDVSVSALGSRGERISCYSVETIGEDSGRGVGRAGWEAAVGRKGMSFGGVACWEIV